jgi:hypothetical protein
VSHIFKCKFQTFNSLDDFPTLNKIADSTYFKEPTKFRTSLKQRMLYVSFQYLIESTQKCTLKKYNALSEGNALVE